MDELLYNGPLKEEFKRWVPQSERRVLGSGRHNLGGIFIFGVDW